RLQSGAGKAVLLEELGAQQEKRQAQEAARAEKGAVAVAEKPVKTVREDAPIYVPNDLRRHVLKDYSVSHLYPYVNMRTLIGHHLGLKGYNDKTLANGDPRAVQLHELATNFQGCGLLKPSEIGRA